MATQFDFKSATPDATFPSGAFLFGADSQSASDPSIYSSNAYLNYLVTVASAWSAAQTFTSAAPQLTLGVNATTLGSIKMFGNTSGDVTLQPTAAAGTATTLTLPATTSTLAGLAIAQTFTATQTITPAANTNALAVTGYSVTGSGTTALVDLAGTWNTSGVASGIKLNITDTASSALSGALEVQYGGSTYFRAGKGASGYSCLWMGAGITPSLSNFIISVTGTTVSFNAPSGGMSYMGTTSGFALAASDTLVKVAGTASFGFTTDASTGNLDVILARDAANTLAQRNTTNAQFHNIYATYTSATDYHRVKIGTAKTTLASVSGATVTATNIIPDGAIVVGVTTKVTVSLGTGGGTSGYQVGDGSDADRWGQIVGTTAGTSTDNTNWTATTVQAFTSAQSVVITADGGAFNGTGSIEVTVQYLIGQCD